MEHMTRRRFVELAAVATGGLSLAGLVGCADDGAATEPAAESAVGGASVYFARNVDDAASRAGKLLIHSAGANRTSWQTAAQDDFLESMADACSAVLAAQPNMLFVNVMNNLSVDCDCDSNPAPPKMADIGVLASTDPVALDQACVDLVYASDDDSADLIERMESRNGVRMLEAAESLGVGSRAYELVELA